MHRAKPRDLNLLYPWGKTLSQSSEPFLNETSDPANLTKTQRGHLAELAFMRKAASLGLSAAKPCNEGERYDFIVRVENIWWRVQVKSVAAKSPLRRHYRVSTSSGSGVRGFMTYTCDEIDFLVAYIFPEDMWYVFPTAQIAGKKAICVSPGSRRSTFEQYREAWRLMRPRPANAAAQPVPEPVPSIPKMMTDP